MSHCQHRSVGTYVSLILRKSTKLNEVLDNWASTKVPFFSFHHSISAEQNLRSVAKPPFFCFPGMLEWRAWIIWATLIPRHCPLATVSPNMWIQPTSYHLDPFPLELGAGFWRRKMMKKTTMLSPQLLREHLRFCLVCGGGVFFM